MPDQAQQYYHNVTCCTARQMAWYGIQYVVQVNLGVVSIMAKNVVGIPVRRVSAEYFGDDAVDLEIMEVTLGLNRNSRNKGDRDTKLMKIAFSALRRAIEQYRMETGERYPDFDTFASWLGARPEGGENGISRPLSSSDSAKSQAHDGISKDGPTTA